MRYYYIGSFSFMEFDPLVLPLFEVIGNIKYNNKRSKKLR